MKLGSIVLSALLSILCFFVILIGEGRDNFIVEASFALNSTICCFMIFLNKNRSYSLQKIFYIFSLFFLCIAPAIQYQTNTTFWTTSFLNDELYIIGNSIILLTLILFGITYSALNKKSEGSRTPFHMTNRKISQVELIGLVIISASSFFIVYANLDFLALRLFYRGGDFEVSESNQIVNLFVNFFIRPLPMVIFAFYRQGQHCKKYASCFFLFIAIITAFPTGIPRLQVAALYIPLFILLTPPLTKGHNFVLVLVFGLLVIFPALNQFRYYSENAAFHLNSSFDMFKEAHFDAYQNFLRTIDGDIITGGWQLLGALFFFIPRMFWENKPVGSGSFLSDKLGFSFDNVSMPLIGEGYMNFGILGVFLFVFLAAIVSAKLDHRYWSNNEKASATKVRYFFILGMFFFLLRGDLLSSTAYTTGLLCSIKLIDFWLKNNRHPLSNHPHLNIENTNRP